MIKKLSRSIREFKLASILSPLFVTLEVAMECIIPLYMVTMLDSIQEDNSLKNIIVHGVILLLLAGFALLFGILSGKFAATASTGFARNLRKDMYY